MALGFAVSIVSAAALGYEILLMRLFSIVQWHHFAAMIISLALLGIGASGTALALGRTWLEPRFAAALPAAAALFGTTAVVSFALAQRIPFNPLELAWDTRQPLYLMLVYLLLAVPFVFAGGFVGIALYWFRERAGRIYRFDLIGAGLGALGAIAALFLLAPGDGLRLIGGLGFAAAALVCLDRAVAQPGRVAAAFAVLAIAFPLAVPAGWLAPRLSPYKGLSQALYVPGATVVAERSGPLGLVTAVESPDVPFRHAPGLSLANTIEPPEQIALFTDGGGLSAVTRFDGDFDPLAYLGFQTAALPYHLAEEPTVLVLGAGGGSAVLRALIHGARRVDAVELNPDVVDLLRYDFAEFSGDLYGRDDVRVYVAEPRAFVAGAGERYDVIAMTVPGAGAAGAWAASASTLYTVEAFAAYLRRLAPGGLLAVTSPLALPPRTGIRLAATAIAALETLGVEQPGRRLALVRGWDRVTLLVKNDALSAADLDAIRLFCRERWFDVAYLPGMAREAANRFNILAEPYLFDAVTELLGEGRRAFLEAYKFHVWPATDDRPYAFRFFKWRSLSEFVSLRGRGGNALIEWSYLILAATLAQAVAAGLVLILLPLRVLPRAGPGRAEGLRTAVYFFALGLGFMFVEIAFIQRFTLFLGHPLYAAAVVLSAFLVFAGLGSGASQRLMERRTAERTIVRAVLAIAIVALLYLAVIPALFEALKPGPAALKVAASVALIAPLAFCMGMPFAPG
ncbi:MAG: SAM-dependent methyltransferase, partial [Proteobacteria bacterium]|nr:SAM-dependent methyltransferase [Pseudomonadota bacterium]